MANWFHGGVDTQKRRLLSAPKPATPDPSGKTNASHHLWASRSCNIRQAVAHAVDGTWSIPAFQRNFMWNPLGVRDLAESLWRDYPIGPLLIWERDSDASSERLPSLIIDGQQRLTSLCILLGHRPRWWSGEKNERWKEIVSRYEVWFDMKADREHFFRAAGEPKFDSENPRYVEVSKLLTLDLSTYSGRRELRHLASRIEEKSAEGLDTEQRHDRLLRVCAIIEQPMIVTILRHPHLDDVLEIFARLNGQGIRFRRLLLSTALHATRRMWNGSH